ncbi:MAG: excinuclease ABC subunit UvrC [Actinobacteria bacterium]|nr:MAG: excinuclease ABC subunit UvrC [Actinomycetota bacterium]
MADPRSYRPAAGSIPDGPGVYRFRDGEGRVIYVGKAKSLRSRLSSYFADLSSLHTRTAAMVTTAASVDWVTVGTEVEALQLEYSWIKEYDPRFNVRYRDDKSYPFLAVTMSEKFPRASVMRGAKRKGTRYFGPFAHAWAIRETVDLLLRVFPVRTCTNGVFRRAEQVGRPCLLGYIERCSAPCVGRVDEQEYALIVDGFVAFMAGGTQPVIDDLTARMRAAAAEQDYERAARLRDDLGALNRVLERNAVVLGDGTDADMFALAADELEAAVQVFHIRAGRIRGQRGFIVERVEEGDQAQLVAAMLRQFYGGESGEAVPRQVLVSHEPDDPEGMRAWLSDHRGSNVDVRSPQRGDKAKLMVELSRNAEQTLALHKTKRSGDLTTRSQAIAELQEALELADAPLRIECIDVSNLQGTDVVASLVVFEDGLPRKSDYRRFNIRQAGDDTAAVAEVVRRRFKRYLAERHEETTPSAFAYSPGLLVIDGGAPQVRAAKAALDELGIDDIAVCGLAKRLEEVWLPGEGDPVILDRTSEGLYLLQRVRDEAHRFAIAGHRAKRGARMTASALDDVPGLGDVRRKALMRRFSSLKKLKQASAEEIAEVPGIGPATASAIIAALAGQPAAQAVNMTTGEIIERMGEQ